MGRPTEQTMKCLRRDFDWLTRIRKRARDNETRDPDSYQKVLSSLNAVMDIIQAELDEEARLMRQDRGRVRAEPPPRRRAGRAA